MSGERSVQSAERVGLRSTGLHPGSRWRRAVLLGSLLAATGCEWFTDFKRQPHVVTWESLRTDTLLVRGSPIGSVPTTGSAMAAFTVSYAPQPATIDSMSGIPNPIPATEASLAAGRKLFQINCAVCHGDLGNGQPVGVRMGLFPWPLTSDAARQRTDGYIFGMIRNGRTNMPSYNRIEERDRWDVVNYVRALQGVVTGVPFETGPLAPPGVTGDKLPGTSPLGPTRLVPYRGTAGGTSGPGGGR
jgi:mono/diheme cytochrome c family protein